MSLHDLLPFSRSSVAVNRGINPLRSFQDEMNRLFSDFFGENSLMRSVPKSFLSITPVLDVIENDKSFTVTVELPGMESKDVQLSVTDNYITIKGEKKQEKKEESDGYFRQERTYGSFQRIVELPATANLDEIEANFKNGVLMLTILKKTGAQLTERKIEIR